MPRPFVLRSGILISNAMNTRIFAAIAFGIFPIIAPQFGDSAHAAGKPEKDYAAAWCAAQGGMTEFVLPDNSRPDCVLDDVVVEFDFGEGMKPYQCAGQALHYARLTGKSPLCILIRRPDASDREFSRAANRVAAPVRCMDENGAMFSCPAYQ